MRPAAWIGLSIFLGAMGSACGWLGSSGPPAPMEYRVVRGDTLSKIAGEYEVSVRDLRTWNQINGDLIEVDQVLLIYPPQSTATPEPRYASSRGTARRPAPQTPSATSPLGLAMPAGKACLPGPSLDPDADEGWAASKGLSERQIRTSMDKFVPHTLQCAATDNPVSGTLTTEITVGCDGRVSQVEILDPGPFDSDVVACVQEVLQFAPFPAHDLPDGETFGYPLRFSF